MADGAAIPAVSIQQAERHDERTRRHLVWLVVIQWNLFVIGVAGAMILRGWELSPAATNVFFVILTAESTALGSVVGYYLGSSAGAQERK